MRKMFRPLAGCLLFLFCMLALISCNKKESDVILISNARIYTFDAGNIMLESGSMAFTQDGEILGVGDNESMSRIFTDARQVNMNGKTVLPGLIDSHGHLYGLALSFTMANLSGTRSKAEVINRLREFEAGLPGGEWLLGRGWDQNDWPE